MVTLYRVLCGVVGAPLVLLGILFVVGFFQALMPGGEAPGPISPLGPMGVYLLAFCGCALVGWGGGLLGAMRRPEAGRSVGTWTAFALVSMATMSCPSLSSTLSRCRPTSPKPMMTMFIGS